MILLRDILVDDKMSKPVEPLDQSAASRNTPDQEPQLPSDQLSKSIQFEEAWKYIGSRMTATAATSAIFGTSLAYYNGSRLALSFYSYGFTGGLVGTTFFGGSYALKRIRMVDDHYNFMWSGTVNGGIIGVIGGYRRGILGALLGSVIGGAYKISSDWLYDTSRAAWVRHRRYNIYDSKPRILNIRTPRFTDEANRQIIEPSRTVFELFSSKPSDPEHKKATKISRPSNEVDIDSTKK